MLDQDPRFRPLEYRAGYLPIEDFSLIGDGATCALVGRDGSVAWMCVPRFDSEPLFCSLLDRARGGHFTIAPEDVLETRQMYEPDTAVLRTELRCRTCASTAFQPPTGWAANDTRAAAGGAA